MTFATSKDSDQPRHSPSLIRVFTVRMKTHWVLRYPLSTLRRLWSDWADAQADLRLCWAHISFCWFCHEAAQLRNGTAKCTKWHMHPAQSDQSSQSAWSSTAFVGTSRALNETSDQTELSGMCHFLDLLLPIHLSAAWPKYTKSGHKKKCLV